MVPSGGEIGSSVSEWMDGAAHQDNVLIRATCISWVSALLALSTKTLNMLCKRLCKDIKHHSKARGPFKRSI